MKNWTMNKIIGCLLVLFSMFCLSVPATADTVLDETQPGSITVVLRDQTYDNAVANAGITVYHVANTTSVNNNLGFVFTDAFRDCGLSVDDYYKVEFAQAMAQYIGAHRVQGTSLYTDADGIARFTALPHGIYMVMQTGEVENVTTFTPFVLVIPITKDNQWVYDVSASPKVDLVKYADISVCKVWNDDNGAGATKRPDSVTVQLRSGHTVVDTVTLNTANGWKHTWQNLAQRDNYSVREINVPLGYEVTYARNGFSFTVINTAFLVDTGQLNWPVPVLIIGGFAFIAVGIVLRNKGKRHE